ncbi:unnamed protein product [Prunus armeniaca]
MLKTHCFCSIFSPYQTKNQNSSLLAHPSLLSLFLDHYSLRLGSLLSLATISLPLFTTKAFCSLQLLHRPTDHRKIVTLGRSRFQCFLKTRECIPSTTLALSLLTTDKPTNRNNTHLLRPKITQICKLRKQNT